MRSHSLSPSVARGIGILCGALFVTGTHTVALNDLITLVNIALGSTQAPACAHGVPSGAAVNVAVIIQEVNSALNGRGVG